MSSFSFTLPQIQALNHDFPSKIQLTGGPGTGKTTVLKQIYQNILLTHQHSAILVLLFNTEAITTFTDSTTTIPPKNYHVYTLKHFWFSILSPYLLHTQNIHLIQLSNNDLRFLKNKFSNGSQNQTKFLKQQPNILYLTSFQILQTCQRYYTQDHPNFTKFMKSYSYIMIDQFQDIDLISYKLLLDYYKQKSIIVSGDDNQSLFSWTKMTINDSMINIKQKFNEMKVFTFEDSFRCTDNNIGTGEVILKPRRGKIHKKIQTKNKFNRPLYLKKYETDKKEAEEIVKQIKLLNRQKGVQFRNIAVLCRRRKLENNIIRAMKRYQIPITRQNIGLDWQVEILVCTMRLYLNKNDFISQQLIEEYLSNNPEVCATTDKIFQYLLEVNDSVKAIEFVAKINHLFKFGTSRANYIEFTTYISNFYPEQQSLSDCFRTIVRESEISTVSNGVSVISSLSIKGLEFDYVFIPGFNYYNYRYNSEEQEKDMRKILYSTISRSRDFVCVSYFNIMNPVGVQFTKLSKKVMELELKIEKDEEQQDNQQIK